LPCWQDSERGAAALQVQIARREGPEITMDERADQPIKDLAGIQGLG
jgi:hypothetical protein